MRMRPFNQSMLPEGIIPWVARYSGSCLCGKKIKPGQSCHFNKETRKLVCRNCSKLAAKGLLEKRAPTEVEQIMDRVKHLYVMPRPLKGENAREMQVLLERLRHEFAHEYSARRLLCEVMRLHIDDDNVCVLVKYADNCWRCGEHQAKGSLAVWCKSAHRLWCLECNASIK
jgi:hypothetical protein